MDRMLRRGRTHWLALVTALAAALAAATLAAAALFPRSGGPAIEDGCGCSEEAPL